MAPWYFSPLKPCHYALIYADPPTYFANFTPIDGAKAPPYPSMSDAWLRELPVENLAAGDCLLCLWSTMPKLEFSFELMRLWGFRYVTAGAWFKRTAGGSISYGMGKVLQSGAEIFLLGARGRPPYVNRPVKGVFESDFHGGGAANVRKPCGEQAVARQGGAATTPASFSEYDAGLAAAWQSDLNAVRREHSRKPDEVYTRLEALMGDVPRCELFSQTDWPGWDTWGAETGKYQPDEPAS